MASKTVPKGPINVTVRSGQSLGANADTGPGNRGLVIVSWKQGEGTVLQDKGVQLGMMVAAVDGQDILESPSTEIIKILSDKFHDTKVLSFVAPPKHKHHGPQRAYTKGFRARPAVEKHWHDNIPLDQITAQQQGVEVAWIVATQRHRRQVKAAAMTLSVSHLARYKSRRMKRKKKKDAEEAAAGRSPTLSGNFMPGGSPGKPKDRKKVFPAGMLTGATTDEVVAFLPAGDDERQQAQQRKAPVTNNFMASGKAPKPPGRKKGSLAAPKTSDTSWKGSGQSGPAQNDSSSSDGDEDEEFNA